MASVVIKNVSTTSQYVRDLQDSLDAGETITISRSIGELTAMNGLNAMVTDGTLQFVSMTIDPTEALWVQQASGGSLIQTADLTLDVDAVSGSDSLGNGSATRPYATIMKAVDAIGHIESFICKVRVHRGTYAETVRDGHMYRDNGLFTSQILIEGQDWTTPTLTSITSGVLGNAPASGITRTVAGASWAANEAKGMFILVSSGALAGQYFPIMANAAGSLDIPSTSSSLNGASFSIVQQACIVTRSPGLFASAIIGNGGSTTTATAMQLKGLKLSSGSFYGAYFGSGQGSVTECLIQGHTFAGINLGSPITVAAASRSYVANGGGQVGVTAGAVAQFFAGAFGVDGGTNGIQITAAQRVGTNSSGHIVIQNATDCGFEFKSGPMDFETFNSQKIICRNNLIGFRAQGGGHFLFQGCEFTNNTSHGLRVLANNNSTAHNSFHMFGTKIQNNGGDGIRIETPHNNVMFGGSGADISSNSGYGVRIGGQPAGYPAASHNSLTFDSSVTMSGNTSGDVTYNDGSTTKTIAQLRIDGFDVDANLFNRVQAS